MGGLSGSAGKDSEIWEVLQLLNGDIYIYRNGFKEEADVKNVFKFNANGKGKRFICFDKNPLKPAGFSALRLNRSAIAVAWYIAADSEIVQELKRTFPGTFPVIETLRDGRAAENGASVKEV